MKRMLVCAAPILLGWCVSAQSSYQVRASAEDAVFTGLRTTWADDLHAKKVTEAVARYTPEAVFVQPDGSAVRGAKALRALYETVTAAYDSDLQFYSALVTPAGARAVDAGSYREVLTERKSGHRKLIHGTYETTYVNQPGAGWLIEKQVWTAAPEEIALDLAAHPTVALTFDDLPAAGSLPPGENRTRILTRLAATLKAEHLEGTYGFVNAVKLENDPDAQQALQAWVDAGMNVGSHTWSHPAINDLTAEAFEEEIAKNEPALAKYGQLRDWRWFRYPFLWEGDTLEKRHAVRGYLFAHGYRVAQVSLDFEDYAWNDAYGRCVAKNDAAAIDWLKQSYLGTAAEYVRLGREEQRIAFGHEMPNVLLLHATAFTTLMLPHLLEQLRGEGFSFDGLAHAESDPAYATDPDAALKYGGTLPDQSMDARHLPYPVFHPKPFEKMKEICR